MITLWFLSKFMHLPKLMNIIIYIIWIIIVLIINITINIVIFYVFIIIISSIILILDLIHFIWVFIILFIEATHVHTIMSCYHEPTPYFSFYYILISNSLFSRTYSTLLGIKLFRFNLFILLWSLHYLIWT